MREVSWEHRGAARVAGAVRPNAEWTFPPEHGYAPTQWSGRMRTRLYTASLKVKIPPTLSDCPHRMVHRIALAQREAAMQRRLGMMREGREAQDADQQERCG